MRTIKFRAWNQENKEMIYLENSGLQYFDFEGSYSLGFTVDAYTEFWAHEQFTKATKKANNFPIMEFTGLLDRNGKEIYEGDLYKVPDSRSVRQVFYHNGAFCGGMSLEESTPLNWGYYIQGDNLKVDDFISCIEVIGNIYEATNTTGSEVL